MAKIIDNGLQGGHLPTLGYYPNLNAEPQYEADIIDSQLGGAPFVRIRMDLDGDGIYEVEEIEDVTSVGSIDRVVEYFTNRPRFGNATFTIYNKYNKYTDLSSKSIVNYDTTISVNDRTRYIGKSIIIDIGFDGLNRGVEDYYVNIFKGSITSKTENILDKTVTFSLMDEWQEIAKIPLSKTTTFYEEFGYGSNTEIKLGTHFGIFKFLPAGKLSKDGQILVPLMADVYPDLEPLSINAKSHARQIGNEIYIWVYNKNLLSVTFEMEPQWCKVSSGYKILGDKIQLITHAIGSEDFGLYGINVLVGTSEKELMYYRNRSITITPMPSNYESYYLSPESVNSRGYGMAFNSLIESNPVKILYNVLINYCNVESNQINISNVDTWLNSIGYSFEESESKTTGCNVTVNANSGTVLDLINKICEVCRGAFFISQGKEIINGYPTRRIEFKINQPFVFDNNNIINNAKVFNPSLSKEVTEIKNVIGVNKFNFSNTALKTDTVLHLKKSQVSIDSYGLKEVVLGGKTTDILFISDSDNYAESLANQNLYIYSEPINKFSFTSDISALRKDLKTVIGFECPEFEIDLSIFEVIGFRLGSNFMINLDCYLANYLLTPINNIGKSWAIVGKATVGNTNEIIW